MEAADPSPSELGAISDCHNHSDVLSFGPAYYMVTTFGEAGSR